jgi:predicted DNA-binding protein (UPF0251 family)
LVLFQANEFGELIALYDDESQIRSHVHSMRHIRINESFARFFILVASSISLAYSAPFICTPTAVPALVRGEGLAEAAVVRRELPPEQREVLTLIGASGLSYEEAAVVCRVGIGTIKSRLSRARAKLVEILELDDAASSSPVERKAERVG